MLAFDENGNFMQEKIKYWEKKINTGKFDNIGVLDKFLLSYNYLQTK